LAYQQVANIANAVAFTNAGGHPLPVFMTLIWGHCADFDETKLGPLTTRFFDCLSKWLRRHRVALRAVWTRERGPNKGHHVHALTNIPIPLLCDLDKYARRVLGASGGAIKYSYGGRGMWTSAMQMGALRYAAKGLDPNAFRYEGLKPTNIADALGIKAVAEGRIFAKRAGCTQNIGPTARRRANWRELRGLDELAGVLNPTPALGGHRHRLAETMGSEAKPAQSLGAQMVS
jgi:hypothetical protein